MDLDCCFRLGFEYLSQAVVNSAFSARPSANHDLFLPREIHKRHANILLIVGLGHFRPGLTNSKMNDAIEGLKRLIMALSLKSMNTQSVATLHKEKDENFYTRTYRIWLSRSFCSHIGIVGIH